MKKIKIGHIGVGHPHSDGKLQCVRKFSDLFEVVGVAESNDLLYQSKSKNPLYDGLKRMSTKELLSFPGLDAVMVETEEWDLVPTAQTCIDAGIPVHLDKPAGENILEFEKLMKDAKQKDLTVQMAYMYRYNPSIQYCFDAIKSGKLGEIFEVDAIMNTEHSKVERAWLSHFKGGIMHFLGCHMVDLVLNIKGIPDEIIPYRSCTHLDDIDAIDNGLAVFQYKNGTSIVRANSTEINGYGRRQLVVCGSKGTIEIKPLEMPTVLSQSLNEDTYQKEYSDQRRVLSIPGTPTKYNERYDGMMLDFAKMIRGEKKNPYSYEYELLLQKVCLKSCGFDVNFKENVSL